MSGATSRFFIGAGLCFLLAQGCRREQVPLDERPLKPEAPRKPPVVKRTAADAKVMAWDAAPPECKGAPSPMAIRPESEYAAMQFIRWVATRLDRRYVGPVSDAPYLDDARAAAADSGRLWFVVPVPYTGAVAGRGLTVGTMADAVRATFDDAQPTFIVEVIVDGSKIMTPGQSPVLGRLRVKELFSDSPYWGRYGVDAKFCVMPTPDNVPDIYLKVTAEF